MKGSAERMIEFLDGSRKRFVIPVYQRNYDWKIDNCKQLFDDLVAVAQYDKPSHFFGSIVSDRRMDDIVIIDGQQRITTLSLLLIAMINALKCGALRAANQSLAEEIEYTYIVDKYRRDERKVRLKPFREDCEAFDRLIYGPECERVSASTVTVNYDYFYRRLTEQRELSVDALYDAVCRLEIIHIQLEPDHGDDPQLIFESLNSTGLDLTETDKIRNYVLMGLDTASQERYYDTYWARIEQCAGAQPDAFIRDLLTVETGVITTMRKIYFSFKQYAASVGDVETLLETMLRYARLFRAVKECDLGDREADAIVARLELLDISVAYPFLLSFLDYYRSQQLPVDELRCVLRTIETFIFRRQICDLPTNALNKIFATLHKQVLRLKGDGDRYSSVMIYVLRSRRLSGMFPTDEMFAQGFSTKNVYAMRSRNRAYLFDRLENGSSRERNDVIGNIEQGILSVEHIMPQTLSEAWKRSLGPDYRRISEEWLHTIANLTLTGYNPSYGNRSFEEKKRMENGFLQSGLRLNQYLARLDRWTEQELKARREVLVGQALRLWEYPPTDFVPPEPDQECVCIDEEFVFTGRSIACYYFRGVRCEVADWTEAFTGILRSLHALDPQPLRREAAGANAWFSSEPTGRYEKIAGDVYVSTGNSTHTKIRILRGLLPHYELAEDEIAFALVPQKQTEA